METRTFPHSASNFERDIVKTLLESLSNVPVEYPQELHDATRAAYVEQVKAKTGHVPAHPVGS